MTASGYRTQSGRVRDTQRQRVYDAEQYAWGQTIPNDRLQAEVDKIMDRAPIKRRWPNRKIHVRLGRNGGHSLGNTITLGVDARNVPIILHEIAHCLTPDHLAPHGPEFAGVLLFLVKTILGKDEHDALRKRFKEGKVRVSLKGIPAPIDRTEERLRQIVAAKQREVNALKTELRQAMAALASYQRGEH